MNVTDTELAVLAALLRKPLYGLAIVERVKEISDGRIAVSLGGVYPALHRMETKNLLESFWGDESENRGARRRYYRVTARGGQAIDQTQKMLTAARENGKKGGRPKGRPK